MSAGRTKAAIRQLAKWRGAGLGSVLFMLLLILLSTWLIIFAPVLLVLLGILLAGVAVLGLGIFWARKTAQGDRILTWDLFLLWLLAINLPAYTRFDQGGVEVGGLFNPQSIGRIVLTLLIVLLALINLVRVRRAERLERMAVGPKQVILPLLLYGWYVVNAGFTLTGNDLLLALFRAVEWFLFIYLLLAVFNRMLAAQPVDPGRRLISAGLPMIAFPVLLAALLAVTLPQMAFQGGETSGFRLQTPFSHSNVLGILAAMLFFFLLEVKVKWRVLCLLLSFAVLVASYSRGAWIGFTLALLAWMVVRVPSGITRYVAVIVAAFFIGAGWLGRDDVLDAASVVLSRNKANAEDVKSASERTVVWKFAARLVRESPWMGHGYVAGPKKLSDLMAMDTVGTYFRARHAHNDFIQAQISGGVIATGLSVLLYLSALVMVVRVIGDPASRRLGRFLLASMLLALTYGMLTPLLSERLMQPGTIVVFGYAWCSVMLALRARPVRNTSAPKVAWAA